MLVFGLQDTVMLFAPLSQPSSLDDAVLMLPLQASRRGGFWSRSPKLMRRVSLVGGALSVNLNFMYNSYLFLFLILVFSLLF